MARIRLQDRTIDKFLADMHASEYRIDEEYRPRWKKVEDAYQGKSRSEIHGGMPNHREVNFNFILSTANTIIPSVLPTDPYISFRARDPAYRDEAKVAEASVNYAYKLGRANSATQKVLLDCEKFSMGVGKVIYNPAGNVTPVLHYDQDPVIELDQENQTDDVSDAILEMMEEDGFFPYVGDDGVDIPTLQRVAPWNFLYPEGYDDLHKCPWVAERMLVKLDDLRMYEGFTVKPSVQANENLSLNPAAGTLTEAILRNPGRSVEAGFVTLYEIHYWVRQKKQLKRRILWLLDNTTATGFDRVVRHIEDDSGMRGYPFVMLRTVVNPGRMCEPSIADLATIQPIADRLNDELGMVLRHHKQASKQKYVAAPGSLGGDSQFEKLLKSERDLSAAELPSQFNDVRQALQLLPIAPMPADVPFVLQMLQRLMYEVGGVDVFQRGGVARKGTTATEVAVASQSFQNRAQVRKRAVEQFIEDVARRYLDCMRRYWVEPNWIRGAGTGEDSFIEVSAEKMRGAFDIEASVSEFDPNEQVNELQAFNGLLQTIGAVVQTLLPIVQAGALPQETIPNFIEKSFDLWNEDKRRLIGPLSSMATPIASTSPQSPMGGQPGGMGSPMPGEDEMAAQVDGNGFNPSDVGGMFGGLAGSGPRPGAGRPVEG